MALKIGISGKRLIQESEKLKLAKAIENKIKSILRKNKTTEFKGVTSLAIGTDTIFAEVVTKVFKMPLKIVLPMPIDEYRKDFKDESDLFKFNDFIENFKDIEITTTSIPVDYKERNDSYFYVGKLVVDLCDEMLFVWDEQKPAGRGGTAEIIGYYYEKKQITEIDYIATKSASLGSIINDEITVEYNTSNYEAIRNGNIFKLIWKTTIGLGLLSVFIFAYNIAFVNEQKVGLKFIFALTEFVLVFVVFVVILIAQKKDYHGKYIAHRLRAEKLRIIKLFYHSNVDIKLSNETLNTDEAIANIIKKINKDNKTSYHSKWYINYTIKSLIENQKKYHHAKVKSIGSMDHFLEKLNLFVVLLFAVNLVSHFADAIRNCWYDGSQIPIYDHHLIVFLSIALPPTYAAIEGWLYFQEWKNLRKNSTLAINSLEDSLKELPVNLEKKNEQSCFEKQIVTVNLVSRIMLSDNTSWNQILEDKNNYHWIV